MLYLLLGQIKTSKFTKDSFYSLQWSKLWVKPFHGSPYVWRFLPLHKHVHVSVEPLATWRMNGHHSRPRHPHCGRCTSVMPTISKYVANVWYFREKSRLWDWNGPQVQLKENENSPCFHLLASWLAKTTKIQWEMSNLRLSTLDLQEYTGILQDCTSIYQLQWLIT